MSLVRFNSHKTGFPSVFNHFFHDDVIGVPLKQTFTSAPAVNIKETETAFGIEVSAPGFDKENFKAEFNDGQLTISAEVKKETEDNGEKYTRKEFTSQSFRRSFNIPEVVDAEQIEANYENGILYINLPKKEEALADKKREIAIL